MVFDNAKTVGSTLQPAEWNDLANWAGLGRNFGLPNYVVYKDGTTYYARNGKTGVEDYSGSVLTTVVNSALAALSSGGLVQLLLVGEHTWDALVTLGTLCVLQGLGPATRLKAKNGFTDPEMIKMNGDDCEVNHLWLDGNKANVPSEVAGIRAKTPYNRPRVRWVDVVNSVGKGFHAEAGINGVFLDWLRTKDSRRQGVLIQDCADNQLSNLHLNGADTGYPTLAFYGTTKTVVSNCWVDFGSLYGIDMYLATEMQLNNIEIEIIQRHGIRIDSGSHRNIFTNINIRWVSKETANTYDGINNAGDDNVFSGIRLYDTDSKMRYGIREESTSDGCTYVCCRSVGHQSSPWSWNGTNRVTAALNPAS